MAIKSGTEFTGTDGKRYIFRGGDWYKLETRGSDNRLLEANPNEGEILKFRQKNDPELRRQMSKYVTGDGGYHTIDGREVINDYDRADGKMSARELGIELKNEGDKVGWYQDGERIGDAYNAGPDPRKKKSGVGQFLGDIPWVGGAYAAVDSLLKSVSNDNIELDKAIYQTERLFGAHGGRTKDATNPDQIDEDIRRVQKKASEFHERGLDEYAKEFGRDSGYDSEARNEVEQGVKGLLRDQSTTRGQVSGAVSRRGLDKTSMGLGAIQGSDNAYSSQISAMRSDIKNRVNNLKKARTEKGMELTSSVLGAQEVPIDFYGRKKERVGGVLPLLGGALGAAFSEKGKRGEGFQVGMGAGQYAEGYGGY